MPPPDAPIDPRTGLSASRLGVYVHFPYCLSKCPYCDFASIVAPTIPEARYTDAIVAELGLRVAASGLGGRAVDSIFIGGGTPSLWAPANVARVLEQVRAALSVSPTAEVTLEANPGAADAGRFEGYLRAGINRLSMGVQSFQARTLSALGRAHDARQAREAFAAARSAGFDNVSLDFIYGVHGQTADEVRADALEAAALGAEHLSAYALTLDKPSLAEEVPLAKQLARGEVSLPADEVVLEMQRSVETAFLAAGLTRYEVSNYARAGLHSRHNALYWTGGEYLALGAGATGFVCAAGEARRSSNHRSADKYLAAVEAGALPESSVELLSDAERFSERVAMGLRLTTGVDVQRLCEDFGQDFGQRASALRMMEKAGLLTQTEGWVRLTPEGLDVHSAVAARVM